MSSPPLSRPLLPPSALPIGLGCSRLGSVNGATGDEALALLRLALDEGVRFFDTSNIYGQGESERLIGQALAGRDDCVVCSKAGKQVPLKMRILTPFKGVLRNLARRSDQARQGVAAARARPMPTRWDAPALTQSLDGSLRRMRRERIEMFMLHSPPADVIARGEAVGALESARLDGKIGMVGVSVDDVETAEAALADPRVRALQLPLRPGDDDFHAVTKTAAASGVLVIAREILGGAQAVSGAVDPADYARARIIAAIQAPGVFLPLVGTTRLVNLRAAIDAARAAPAIL